MTQRIALLLTALALTLSLGTAPARAAAMPDSDRYAAFVADMETGEVLHARRADALRYPASLTKMMTLYMLFEAMERGELSLETWMPVSAEAASRPPTKLGVPAGREVQVQTAIRALVIRSANDIAVVVAEHLAGSEPEFARRMTERARRLGMENTTFRNASGLPDLQQQTTARDMARLAYALRRDFPQYYHFFSERSFSYGGTTYRTHNSLVGNVRGIDGLKTGYIRASGFNIAVSGRRHEDSLVAIVMGGATGAVRDAHARELVEAAFGTMAARRDGVILASLDSPRLNPIREQEILVAETRHLPQPAAMGSIEGAPPLQVVLQDTPDMARPAREEDRPIPLAESFPAVYSEPIAPPASPGRDEALDSPGLPQPQQRAAMTQASHDAVPVQASASLPVGWSVQVGAFASQAAAQARLESVAAMAPQLRGARPVTDQLDRDGRTLHRARFEALDAADARAACEALSRLGEACFAVSPNA